ncbi:MAG: N-acetyltransferase family protein, partial [Rhodospirillaceae bacterium]
PHSEEKANLRDSVRDKTPFLVAVDGTRVDGMASVFGNGVPSLKHCGDIGMTLLPEYREMGLGTKLLEGLIKKSRGKYETLVLWVFKKNKRARNLYKKMGFEPRGAVKRGVKLPSGFDDTLLMQMPLRGGRTT